MTSKLQVTIPRVIARAHGLCPGSEIEFESAGEVIRVVPANLKRRTQGDETGRKEALRWFDEATKRQNARNAAQRKRLKGVSSGRGWMREDLYEGRVDR